MWMWVTVFGAGRARLGAAGFFWPSLLRSQKVRILQCFCPIHLQGAWYRVPASPTGQRCQNFYLVLRAQRVLVPASSAAALGRGNTVLATTLGNQWGYGACAAASSSWRACALRQSGASSLPALFLHSQERASDRSSKEGHTLAPPPHFLPRRTAGFECLRKSLPLEFSF